jgi:hypothetical protein
LNGVVDQVRADLQDARPVHRDEDSRREPRDDTDRGLRILVPIAMYAHRFGRTLFVLDRGPEDPVRASRSSRDGTVVLTPWPQQRRAVLIASEAMTDEPWSEVGEGELLRIDRAPAPRWRSLAA